MAGSLLQHPLRDASAVALIWVSVHLLFDLLLSSMLIPNQFTTMGITGITGGLSLFITVLYLQRSTS